MSSFLLRTARLSLRKLPETSLLPCAILPTVVHDVPQGFSENSIWITSCFSHDDNLNSSALRVDVPEWGSTDGCCLASCT
ncbi:hypothetical protein BD309DRAFT_960430 [Dichomitus squalens]|nr:hypothetical protein BD309DRAFT_960430 [Dichomitus squalens]